VLTFGEFLPEHGPLIQDAPVSRHGTEQGNGVQNTNDKNNNENGAGDNSGLARERGGDMEELLLEKLLKAGKEQAKMMKLLKAREHEIESLHQLLWHSEVAPNQVELQKLSKLFRRRSSCQDDEHEVEIVRLTYQVEATLTCT
jgi:hypothetical protein